MAEATRPPRSTQSPAPRIAVYAFQERPTVGLFALAACVAALPLFTDNPYLLHITILAMIYAGFAASWNLATGYAGLKSFGHQAFFGIGAYSSALLAAHLGLSPWQTVWIAALLAAFAGCLVALPVLRLKSVPHVAIVTLAFAEIVRLIFANAKEVTRGELGLTGIAPLGNLSILGATVLRYDVVDKTGYFYTALLLLAVILIGLREILRSRFGLTLMAIRESDVAAESLGVNLTVHKVAAFGISAFFVGVLGAFYAHYVLVLTPASVAGVELMMLVVAITLVGGIGTFQGPVIAAFVLTIGLESLRFLGDYRMLVYGCLIAFVVLIAPEGLFPRLMSVARFSVARKPHKAFSGST